MMPGLFVKGHRGGGGRAHTTFERRAPQFSTPSKRSSRAPKHFSCASSAGRRSWSGGRRPSRENGRPPDTRTTLLELSTSSLRRSTAGLETNLRFLEATTASLARGTTFFPPSPSCSERETSCLEARTTSPGDIDDGPSTIDARSRAKSDDFVFMHSKSASAKAKIVTRDALRPRRNGVPATSRDEDVREAAVLRRENGRLAPTHAADACFTRSDVGGLQSPCPVFVVAR
jgi:hypothetical protein